MLKISVLFAMLIIVARFTKAPDPYHDMSVLEETNPNILESPISIDSIRSKRSTNDLDFDSFVKKMKMPGRVFAGISLEIGLIDDSIPTDEALAELMNLDGVTLGNLEEFKQNRINDFFSKLKKLKLDVSQELNDLGETISLINTWVTDYGNIKNPRDINAVSAYVEQFKKLKNNNFNFAGLGTTVEKTKLKKILTGLDYFKTINKSNDDADLKRSTLVVLKGDLKKLEASNNALVSMKKLANENLVLTEKFKLSICEFTNLYDDFLSKTDKLKLTTSSVDSLINSFQGVSNMSQSFKDSTTDFLSLVKTMQSIQKRRYPFPRTHTSGLTEGHHDLREISNLVKDPFFKSTIGDFRWETVESGLRSLNLIAEKSGHLEEKWKTLEQLNILEELQKVLSNYEKLSRVTANSANIADLITPVLDFKAIKSSDVLKEAKKMCADFSFFNQKTNAVISALKESVKTKLFENSKKITELYNLINSEDAKNDLNTILKNMKKFTELDQFIQYLNEQTAYFKKIDSLLKDFDFDKSMENILNNHNKIDKLMKDKDTDKFIERFDNLKTSSKSLNSISDAVSVTKEMQKIKKNTEFFTNIATATKIIGESLPALRDLHSIPASIKKNQNAEVKELMKLKDFRKVSKKFGDALEGIVHLKRVMDAQKKFDQLLNEGQHIDNEIRKLNDHELVQEIQKSWGDFKVLDKKVTELKAMLEDRKKIFVKDRSKRSLEDFSQYFTGMAGLVDFDLDISQKLKGLKRYIEKRNSVDVENVLNVLGDLETLDLHFSKFNKIFSAMPETLKEIQTALQNVLNPDITKKLQPSPPTGNRPPMPINPSPQSKPSQLLQSTNTTSNTENTSSTGLGWWIIPVMLVVGVILGVIGFCLYTCLKPANPINKESMETQMLLKNQKEKQSEVLNNLREDMRKETNEMNHWKRQVKAAQQEAKAAKQKAKDAEKLHQQEIKRLKKEIKKKPDNNRELEVGHTNQQDELKIAKTEKKRAEGKLNVAKIKEAQSNQLVALMSASKGTLEQIIGNQRSQTAKPPTKKVKKCSNVNGVKVFAKVPVKCIEDFNEKNQFRWPDKKFENEHKDGTLLQACFTGNLNFCSDATNHILGEKISIAMDSIRNRNVIWRKQTKVPVYEEINGTRKDYSVSANYFLLPSTDSLSESPIIAQMPKNDLEYLTEFWLMISLEKPNFMVFFDHRANNEDHYPKELDNTKTYGNIELIVMSKQERNGYVFRQLRLINEKNKEQHDIDHYEFYVWIHDKIPKTKDFRDAFKEVYRNTRRKLGKKLFVYDKEGSFKAATFLSVEYIAQVICYQIDKDFIVFDMNNLLAKILMMRGNVFTDGAQVMFIQTMALEILYEDAQIEIPEHLNTKWNMFENFDNEEYDQQLRAAVRNSILQKTQSSDHVDVEQGR